MKEEKTMLLKLYASNLRKSAELIDQIIPVVKSFDGKCYNARFQNKINEVLTVGKEPIQQIKMYVEDFDYKRCTFELSFFKFREVYTEENYSFDEPGAKKHRQVHYLPNCYDTVTICNLWTDYNTWDSSKNKKFDDRNDSYFWIDSNYNTRINAEAIVQNMTEHKKSLIKKAEELEDSLTVKPGFNECKIEAWIEAVEDLHKKASELNNAIPSVIKDIFEIKSCASWS